MAGRKLSASLLALVLILAVLPLSASANSPEVPPWYDFELTNLPQGTAYVDLLIHLPINDDKYVPLEKTNIPYQWPETAQIITYCEEDYRSYTFHYADASSYIQVGRGTVTFFNNAPWESTTRGVRYDQADEIASRGAVKLAMLDQDGSILKVSAPLSLKPRQFLSYLAGTFRYDAAADTFEVETYINGFGVTVYPILVLLGILFTCTVEGLTAGAFGLRKEYCKLIKWTNVVSQLLMHLSYILFYSLVFWKYAYATLILEFAVYTGEYLFYRWRMKRVHRKTCLAFTLTANTASLVLGLLLITLLT